MVRWLPWEWLPPNRSNNYVAASQSNCAGGDNFTGQQGRYPPHFGTGCRGVDAQIWFAQHPLRKWLRAGPVHCCRPPLIGAQVKAGAGTVVAMHRYAPPTEQDCMDWSRSGGPNHPVPQGKPIPCCGPCFYGPEGWSWRHPRISHQPTGASNGSSGTRSSINPDDAQADG